MDQVTSENSHDDLIYHVTTLGEWQQAQVTGFYDRSTKGKSFAQVGFIHASTAIQLEGTKDFVYGDAVRDLVVLVISQRTLAAAGIDVRFEDGGEGDFYPHIYAPIPVNLILDTISL